MNVSAHALLSFSLFIHLFSSPCSSFDFSPSFLPSFIPSFLPSFYWIYSNCQAFYKQWLLSFLFHCNQKKDKTLKFRAQELKSIPLTIKLDLWEFWSTTALIYTITSNWIYRLKSLNKIDTVQFIPEYKYWRVLRN